MVSVPALKDVTPDVESVSLCLVSKIYNPEKYEAMINILIEQYLTTGDPTKLLEGYLSVYTTGKFSKGKLSFDMDSYVDSKAMIAGSCLKDISRMLGVDAVVLWNAVLLKKRILVVCDNLPKLLAVVRTLPQLAWHRKDWSILRPLVSSDQEYLDDLASCGVFIAGTTDPTLSTAASTLFDVVFSVLDRRVIVAESVAADMRMGSVHRDISQILTDAESNPEMSDQDLIKAVAVKTEKMVKNLQSLAGDSKLTEAIIKENVANESMQQWLCRVAIAEGML